MTTPVAQVVALGVACLMVLAALILGAASLIDTANERPILVSTTTTERPPR